MDGNSSEEPATLRSALCTIRREALSPTGPSPPPPPPSRTFSTPAPPPSRIRSLDFSVQARPIAHHWVDLGGTRGLPWRQWLRMRHHSLFSVLGIDFSLPFPLHLGSKIHWRAFIHCGQVGTRTHPGNWRASADRAMRYAEKSRQSRQSTQRLSLLLLHAAPPPSP